MTWLNTTTTDNGVRQFPLVKASHLIITPLRAFSAASKVLISTSIVIFMAICEIPFVCGMVVTKVSSEIVETYLPLLTCPFGQNARDAGIRPIDGCYTTMILGATADGRADRTTTSSIKSLTPRTMKSA